MEERGRVPRTITLSVKSLVLIVVVAAAVVGGLFVQDLAEQQDDLEEEMAALAEVVEAQEQRIDGAIEEIETAGSQALIPLRRRLTTVATCLPELQAQVNSMEVDFGFAFPSDPPSQRCHAVLYGNQTGEGE